MQIILRIVWYLISPVSLEVLLERSDQSCFWKVRMKNNCSTRTLYS
jgi:hypothetical protein